MAPHSSTLAWKIPWMEEPGGLQSMGSRRVGTTERLHFHFSLSCFGEGNGNPLQRSCLENPRDDGAWGGCCLWGCTESDTTEATWQQQQGYIVKLVRVKSCGIVYPVHTCFQLDTHMNLFASIYFQIFDLLF